MFLSADDQPEQSEPAQDVIAMLTFPANGPLASLAVNGTFDLEQMVNSPRIFGANLQLDEGDARMPYLNGDQARSGALMNRAALGMPWRENSVDRPRFPMTEVANEGWIGIVRRWTAYVEPIGR